MRDLTQDSRLILLMLGAKGVEATGRALATLWQRSMRSTRASHQLRNLKTAGLIESRGSGPLDTRLFRISPRGRRIMLGDFDPEARWARPWDGKWRMVMFDIPQAQAALRVRLRRTLRGLCFGWLQNSVWLSPDPVAQLLQQLGRAHGNVESLLFMEGRPAGGESDADLVAGAWDFPKLASLHASYMKLLRLRPSSGRSGKSTEWISWLANEARAWQELLRHDPFLPEALLPRDYVGQAVWRARRDSLERAGRVLVKGIV